MPVYPSPETWEYANERQRKRALRSFTELRKRSVPVYSGPLFVDDDEEVKIQPPNEVARRTMGVVGGRTSSGRSSSARNARIDRAARSLEKRQPVGKGVPVKQEPDSGGMPAARVAVGEHLGANVVIRLHRATRLAERHVRCS